MFLDLLQTVAQIESVLCALCLPVVIVGLIVIAWNAIIRNANANERIADEMENRNHPTPPPVI